MADRLPNDPIGELFLRDRRNDRRWRNVRFAGWMFILILYAILLFAPAASKMSSSKAGLPYVAMVRLSGTIMANTTFSARRVLPELRRAFADKKSKGVVLAMNSPGGSPVQASIIHDKILQLKKRYKKKVIVVASDSLASGAYLVATAADKIYVNRNTLTGSIGVVMGGFGFVDTLKKVGMTRRLFTAGANKARLDSFLPLNSKDVAKVKTVLTEVHQDFIQDVVDGRGNRLKGSHQKLFSGDFWTGATAVKLGLVDGTANLWTVLQDEFGVKHYRDYTAKASLVQSLFKQVDMALHLHLLNNNSPLREQAY